MNGEIAQLIAVTCQGNGFLRDVGVSDFFPGNSTCQFCDAVQFVEFKKVIFGGVREKQVSPNPDHWFELLREHGVVGLRLSHAPRNDPNISDRMAAGFVGGGGNWAVEAVQNDGRSTYWRSRWEVWNQKAEDRRIWRVAYGQVAAAETATVKNRALSQLRGELLPTLGEIHDFAKSHDCGSFADRFATAIESLTGTTFAPRGYHKDLAPAGTLSTDAQVLLDVCQTAWVFGGMGSWNDMVFDGEDARTYDRVSECLFRLLTETIPAAANDSFKPN